VIATIPVGDAPFGIAVSPDGSKVYVTNSQDFLNSQSPDTVSVIDAAMNTVTATVTVGLFPEGVAVTPDSSKAYIANTDSGTVSMIDAATNTVTATISVGSFPQGVAVTPDGSKVYVTSSQSVPGTVSVIDTATNTVASTITVAGGPSAFGIFIQPRFARKRGSSNCFGQSVTALQATFGGLNAAAVALEFAGVGALQNDVSASCK
jgi:YVTN family beta-propeller protein